MNALFLFIFFLLSPELINDAIPLKIKIQNIRSSKGNIVLAIFDSPENYKNEKACFELTISKDNMYEGALSVVLCIASGTYGIAVFDDENGDGKINYNLLGLPKEGFGFSNYYHKGFRNPKFSKFKFNHTSLSSTVIIDLRYL